MAVLANTYRNATLNREDLSDRVPDVFPASHPFLSMIQGGKAMKAGSKGSGTAARNSVCEWGNAEGESIDTANKRAQGEVFANRATTPPKRYQNIVQLMDKQFAVSDSQEKIDNAGNSEHMKAIMMRQAIALTRDLDYALFANVASANPSDGSAKTMGGLLSWAKTNTIRGASGADGGYVSSTKLTKAATAGTARAMTRDHFDTLLAGAFNNTQHVPTMAQMTVENLAKFAKFMANTDVAQLRTQATSKRQNAIIASATVYVGVAGKITCYASEIQKAEAQAAASVAAYNPSMLDVAYLQKMRTITPGKRSYNTEKVLSLEATLVVWDEKAIGVIADIS